MIFKILNFLFGGKNMSKTEIKELIQAGATIVDVRSPDEFKDGHYKKAINIPVSEMERRAGELGKTDSPVILYCLSGGRCIKAKSILEKKGFQKVYSAGGLKDMPNVD